MRQNIIFLVCFTILKGAFALASAGHDRFQPLEEKERYNQIVRSIRDHEIDDGEAILEYGSEALNIALRLRDSALIADSYRMIGLGNSHLNNFDIAIEYYLNALEIKEDLAASTIRNNQITAQLLIRTDIAELYTDIANVYGKLGDHKVAIEFYHKSIEVLENSVDDRLINAYKGIALSYYSLSNNDEAACYYKKLYELYTGRCDTLGIASVFNNMGLVYTSLEKYQEALQYYENALALYRSINDKTKEAIGLFNLANLEGMLNNYSNKVAHLNQAMKIVDSIGFERGIVKVNINLALHYINSEQDLNRAETYLQKALSKAQEVKMKDFIIQIYEIFSMLFQKRGAYEKALYYQELCQQKKDSLYLESNRKVAGLRMKYETEKLEKVNELLKKEARINELIITKEKNLRYFLILFSVLVIVVVLVLYNKYNFKNKVNKLLEEKKHELEVANITKDKFFSIIAHDLKNPLSATTSLSGLLYSNYHELPEEEKQNIIKIIRESSAFTYDLLENLLQWSLSQSERMKFQPVGFDLSSVVSDTLELLAVNIRKKELTVKSSIDPGTYVLADKNMLSLVVRNLLTNAIKFTGHGGKIEISSEPADDAVTVSVADTGIGISPGDLGKLFRIDTNANCIGKSKEKGTGLGLILCREFIEKNGGKIWAESEEGKGSIFSFTLKKINSGQ